MTASRQYERSPERAALVGRLGELMDGTPESVDFDSVHEYAPDGEEEAVTITTGQSAAPYALQPDEGRRLEALHIRFLSDGVLSGGSMTVIECVNPGPGGPPLHVHRSYDECYYVTGGRYRFKFGDREFDGGPGTFAYAPRGTAHTFASVGPEEGRVIGFIFPAGLERFLESLAELDRRGAAPDEYAAVFRDHDSEVVGPGLV